MLIFISTKIQAIKMESRKVIWKDLSLMPRVEDFT